jgi:ParB-like chromosome segregation protein Spo0J
VLDKQLGIEVHPAANIFPMIKGKAFDELVEDIRQNGLKESVVFYQGQLLDGRNRYRACQVLGIDPEAAEIDEEEGFDPVAWVLSMNLHRRHLGETEREAIGAKIANLKHGDVKTQKNDATNVASKYEVAEQLNVNAKGIERAKSAIKGGCKQLVEKLEAGEIPSSTAANFVKAVPDKRHQAEILKGGLKAVREVIKESKQEQSRPSIKTGSAEYQEELEDATKQEELTSVLVGIRRSMQSLTYAQLVALREYCETLIQEKHQ